MRQKIYIQYEVPTSIVEIVKAICCDYDRREKEVKRGNVFGEVLSRYMFLNSVIDKALEEVEVGIRRNMLEDIQKRRGYNFSQASVFISKNAYYRRKRKIIHDIAVGLVLI